MRYVYPFDHAHAGSRDEITALLGGKAANLAVMANELGLPVPPGFTITTAACRAYLGGGWPAGLEEQVREQMTGVEVAVGRRFGDPADPLLVSVRSGAPVSMPGMMDTILNLGLSAATEAGLARASGDAAFAADCRTRFTTMYREIVGVADVPDDPWLQLRAAIEAVFRSWNSDRARAYRAHEGIPDDLGTAVTVQAMVFGNRGADSATGVLFTRNPATGAPGMYGDLMFDAQGEDVVAGTHRTEPIGALGARMPAVAAQLHAVADTLERHYADMCDIEFTIEQGRLWLLQCRIGKRSPQAALRIALDMAGADDFPLSRAEAIERVRAQLADPPIVTAARDAGAVPLARGLAASPGVASGAIVTSPGAAETAAAAGRKVILVRAETSPDDVAGMARSAGILTSHGGLVSHAAVVARGWGIPAVVGAAAVEVGADAIHVGGTRLAAGETISIDGGTGEIFRGEVGGTTTIAPEAARLLAWARELGISIDGSAPPVAGTVIDQETGQATDAGSVVRPVGGVEPDDLVRALAIKGLVLPDALGDALLATAEQIVPAVERLVADGFVEQLAGAARLTAAGKERGLALNAADQAAWGVDRATTALDAFIELDHVVKEVVTAWQMKEVDGEQALNDHADAAYDAAVLDRLAALHERAGAWLDPLIPGLPRLAAYRRRLDRAAEQVRGGDGRFIASPRVDSYHSVWFELHEDLIRLAGRTRADEVAAGRA